jgi:hypothetical protein
MRGRSALLKGQVETAEHAFITAGDRFRAAGEGPAGLLLRALSWVPVLGNSPEAALAVARAGALAADAGATIAGTVADLPGGLSALAPAVGAIPIEPLVPLAAALSSAEADVAAALEAVRSSPRSFLIAPVAQARRLADDELSWLHSSLRSGALILEGLPRFLGEDETRRYFFAAQNPAELRGTGGVLGAFSILTVDDGRFEFSPFQPIQSLPIPQLSDVEPPSEEYAENYDRFRGDERFWLAINLTPDVPTASRAILAAYEVVTGTRLDGVVIADPFALQALLRVTGGTVIPRLGVRVTAANVVDLVTNEAFSLFPEPEVRKRVLGAVASGVFRDFIQRSNPSADDLLVLVRMLGEGHLLLYSTDPLMQEGLAGTPAGGTFGGAEGDFLSVIENSSGANKVHYYQDRSVGYSVELEPAGTAHATAEITLGNRAPTSGEPRYVLGPRPPYSSLPGESGQLVNVYCGAGCQLESAYRDGARVSVWTGMELGYRFYQDHSMTSSGETTELRMRWYLPEAWQGDDRGGFYRLTFRNQTTIRPTELTVEVWPPPGMSIVDASPGMNVDADQGTATWEGVPRRDLVLTITFQPPLPQRLWRTLT